MEMIAAIEGMRFLEEPHHIYLVSDSAYLLNTLKYRWFDNWVHPEARPNWGLWQELIELIDFHEVEYVKVKGHSGDMYNEQVDRLAYAARKEGTGGGNRLTRSGVVLVSHLSEGHVASPQWSVLRTRGMEGDDD